MARDLSYMLKWRRWVRDGLSIGILMAKICKNTAQKIHHYKLAPEIFLITVFPHPRLRWKFCRQSGWRPNSKWTKLGATFVIMRSVRGILANFRFNGFRMVFSVSLPWGKYEKERVSGFVRFFGYCQVHNWWSCFREPAAWEPQWRWYLHL